jgi:hypothetical protein
VGQLSDIKPNESGKKVTATTQFYERDLTQREIESITSMEPLHGSLGFSCCLEMTGGEWNGQHYDAVERGPYVFYEYSLVRQGVVTPEDGAGFNMECANHQNTEAPGGADMDANELRQIIEEAQKPLMDRIAALEQTNTELQGELVGMKEQGKIDKAVATVERFAAKLKPGFQESAAELFEASQKDPLWITENADKFIQAGQESRLQGKATTEGAVAVWSLEKARAQAKLDGKVI